MWQTQITDQISDYLVISKELSRNTEKSRTFQPNSYILSPLREGKVLQTY